MRQFGKDAPEFMSFQLGDSEEVYKIPLAASLPARTLLEMKSSGEDAFEWQLDFLKKYIGDAADELTAGTVKEIMEAWVLESGKIGASVGESKASSD